MSKKTSPLADIIAAEIRSVGPIPFSRYMELCLYHPEHGYYQRANEVTGRQGDFFTAPHVHRLFGATLARWLMEKAAGLGIDPFTVLELGPGNGLLAKDLLDSVEGLGGRHPLILVDASIWRQKTLAEGTGGRGARVIGPDGFEALAPFHGFVIANEFFDSLPVRIITRTGGELSEVLVCKEGGGFIEQPARLDLKSLDPATAEVMASLPEGFRAEFAPEGRQWLFRLSKVIGRGFVIILDYGDVADMLAAPWREGGTLRCFSTHRIDSDPYERPGEKDITASVNFSLLRAWAEGMGFSVEAFTTQSSFLVRAGILDLMAEGAKEGAEEGQAPASWPAVKTLIMDEGGMGEAFKVMVLKKD